MSKYDEYNEILAALALDALDQVEARQVVIAVAADAELGVEFDAWREVAAHLACHAPAVEPPPECKGKILAAIKTFPRSGETNSQAQDGAQKINQNVATASNVVAFPTRTAHRRSFLSYAPTLGAIAASIVAVLLGVALYNSVNSNQTKNNQIAELNQKLLQTEQRLNETQAQFEQRISAVQAQLERKWQEPELLGSPNSFDIELAGTGTASNAKARLVLDRQTGRAMLFVENLPPAPPGKVYQVWFISDPKNPYPGAVFSTNTAGSAVFRDNMPAESLKASTFAVTLEPEGGSPSPTTTPILIKSVS